MDDHLARLRSTRPSGGGKGRGDRTALDVGAIGGTAAIVTPIVTAWKLFADTTNNARHHPGVDLYTSADGRAALLARQAAAVATN